MNKQYSGHLVIWSFVKIENGKSKSDTIIINIYIYLIVSNDRVSEIDFDHFDLDHLDQMASLLTFGNSSQLDCTHLNATFKGNSPTQK